MAEHTLAGRDFVRAPTGLILPDYLAEARYRPRRPKAVDLFAGAGGMSCGLKQAGWHVVAAVEWDCTAAMTYATNLCRYGDLTMHFIEEGDRVRMNKTIEAQFARSKQKLFPTAGSGWIAGQPDIPGTQHLFIGDIRKLTGKQILDAVGMEVGELDCVAGGPPCQGFSKAGKRNVMDPRNSLVFDFARLILELRPKTMIMENVPGMLTMVTPEGVPVVDALARILEDGDFMTAEALKVSLAAQTDAVGLLRSNTSDKQARKNEARPMTTDQIDMFEEVF